MLTLAVVAVTTATTATTARSGRANATEWFRAAADGCRTVGWPKCVSQNVARTFRLLEDSDDFPIAGGVRLVRTAAKTTATPTAYVFR